MAQRARAAALSLWKPSPKGTGDEGKASPLETNPQGDGERQRKDEQGASNLQPGVRRARRCGDALI